MNPHFVPLVPLALLAACGRDKDPTTVTVTTGDNRTTEINAEPGKESRLKIDTDGFKADIKMPGLGMMASRMDIDGVDLYPDSKVAGVNIDGGKERFAMRFDAPADRGKVSAWFRDQFAENDFTARPTPTGFAGTKKDGDWFTLDLTDTPDGHTLGDFKLGKRQR